mgnify:FL=1
MTEEQLLEELLSLKDLPYELNEELRERAAVGLVVLATDQVIEHEFRRILDIPGVALFESRIRNETQINWDTLAAMESRLAEAVDLILPGMPMDVVAFGCTSASMVIGPERITSLCRESRPSVLVTNPVSAALEALKSLEASSIALLTPYRDDLNSQFRDLFTEEGIQVPVMGSFNEEDDNRVGRIGPDSIENAVLELGVRHGVNAIFVSCTNLRIAEQIESLERKLGKAVTSSNHAMAWHALRLAGIRDLQPHWGKLFECR